MGHLLMLLEKVNKVGTENNTQPYLFTQDILVTYIYMQQLYTKQVKQK